MKEWMTIEELSEYLQVPVIKIRHLNKQDPIPHHKRLGTDRYYKPEIDDWMMSKTPKNDHSSDQNGQYIYRGRPIKNYMLTASKVLIGPTALNRLPNFIKKAVDVLKEKNGEFLLSNEFKPFVKNFNDYLRLSCQLGLIDSVREGRYAHYFPTEFALRIYDEVDEGAIKEIIKESILDIVQKGKESIPRERHAVFLLWYLLKIRDLGKEPEEYHFNKEENNFFPTIRLNFIKGLYDFLFGKNEEKGKEFLKKWDQYI